MPRQMRTIEAYFGIFIFKFTAVVSSLKTRIVSTGVLSVYSNCVCLMRRL